MFVSINRKESFQSGSNQRTLASMRPRNVWWGTFSPTQSRSHAVSPSETGRSRAASGFSRANGYNRWVASSTARKKRRKYSRWSGVRNQGMRAIWT